MQRILFLIFSLMLIASGFGQSRYTVVQLESKTGVAFNDASAYVTQMGQSTKYSDLTYLDGSAGHYYADSALTTGFYDVYFLAGGTYRKWGLSPVYVNFSQQSVTSTNLEVDTLEARTQGLPINLKDPKYGVAYNDSTANYTNKIALRAAMDDAMSTGRPLMLGGDTLYTDSLTYENAVGITIQGPGVISYRAANKRRSNQAVIKFINSTDITIRDLTIIGNMDAGFGGAETGAGYENAVHPLYFQGGSTWGINRNIVLDNIRVKDAWWIAFGGSPATSGQIADTVALDVTIRDSYFLDPVPRGPVEDLGNTGIRFEGYVEDVWVIDNQWTGLHSDGTIYGNGFVHFAAGRNIHIRGNKAWYGFDSILYTRCDDVEISNNDVRYGGKDLIKNIEAIGLMATTPGWVGVQRARIFNNYVEATGENVLGSPILINVDGYGNDIYGNVGVAGDTSGYTAKQSQIGIKVNGHNNRIYSNTLRGRNYELPGYPGSIAIFVPDTAATRNSNIITENKIDGWRYGVVISSTTWNPYIANNTLTNIDSIGIHDYSPKQSYTKIVRNNFDGVKHIYRISGSDSLLRAFNTYSDYTLINGATPNVADVSLDTLNIALD